MRYKGLAPDEGMTYGHAQRWAMARSQIATSLNESTLVRLDTLSIRINDQWRICFTWIAGDTHEVDIVDYH